jgi:tetratricopeptide (TPR) repeat protein
LVEVATGLVEASHRIQGEGKGDIFSAVDRLSTRLRDDILLPDQTMSAADRPVADITANSLEAYRHYLEGVASFRSFRVSEATASFRSALSIDSTIAMAYYYLAGLTDFRLIEKAEQYSYKANRLDRDYIRSRAALYSGDYQRAATILEDLSREFPREKGVFNELAVIHRYNRHDQLAIDALNRVLELDPTHAESYNQLAYLHMGLNDLNPARDAIQRYAEHAPDDPNVFDSQGDLYLKLGKLDSAEASYREALAIEPDFWHSVSKIGHVYLLEGQPDRADSCYRLMLESDVAYVRVAGRLCLANAPLRFGRFQESLSLLDKGLSQDGREVFQVSSLSKLTMKAFTHAVTGGWQQAIETAHRHRREYLAEMPDDPVGAMRDYGLILAMSWNLEAAEAVADTMRTLKEASGGSIRSYHLVLSAVEWKRGNFDKVSTHVDGFLRGWAGSTPYIYRYVAGRLYCEIGQSREAAFNLEQLFIEWPSTRFMFGALDVTAHYYLGRAYEDAGRRDDALEQYSLFLGLWDKADTELPEIADGRFRLERLQSQP